MVLPPLSAQVRGSRLGVAVADLRSEADTRNLNQAHDNDEDDDDDEDEDDGDQDDEDADDSDEDDEDDVVIPGCSQLAVPFG